MKSWGGARKKLEQDYLAPSLRGKVQYYVTNYSECPEHTGSAAIRFKGKELLRGGYSNQWLRADCFPTGISELERWRLVYDAPSEICLELGAFDEVSFYNAFKQFDTQSIEKSLASKSLLVRIFAVLDRRVGKRRLWKMREDIEQQPALFQTFYDIRAAAEGLSGPEGEDE